MSRTKLDNYLRAYRKRSGLSQDEVAYLLGSHSGTKVSRYERNGRQPDLDTALKFKAIFRLPVGVLFAGREQRANWAVRRRAARLQARLAADAPKNRSPRKLQALAEIRQVAGGMTTLAQ